MVSHRHIERLIRRRVHVCRSVKVPDSRANKPAGVCGHEVHEQPLLVMPVAALAIMQMRQQPVHSIDNIVWAHTVPICEEKTERAHTGRISIGRERWARAEFSNQKHPTTISSACKSALLSRS